MRSDLMTYDAGGGRRDHRIDVAALGGDVGSQQGVLVLLDDPRAHCLGIVGLGDLLAVQDVHRALRAHDRDLRGRPGDVDVGAEVLRPHHVVRAAERLAGDHRDLRDGRLGIGVDQLGAAPDDAGVFLADAGQEAGNVHQRQDRAR